MTPAARLQSAIDLLAAIEATPGRPADGVVSSFFQNRRYAGAKDRREIVEAVYRILRRRARLDWWIGRAGGEPAPRSRLLADLALDRRAMPEDLRPLFDGQGHHPPPLGADERRLVARLSGQPLFHHDMPDWVRGEYPEWLHPRLAALFGDGLAVEMGAMRDEAPLDLRVNTLKATREQALAALAAEGIEAEPTPLSPLGLRMKGRLALGGVKAFRDGLVEVQDEGSQLVALLADARPGQAVVDYCAGAGGKTLAMAAAMANKGRLIACDVSSGRVARAQERLRRAGVHNVVRRVLEAEGDRWVKRNAAAFDRVLVDAPCSGTGTWRRNPDAKWVLRPTDVEELTALQARILDTAARLVRDGGRLIYATCSLLAEENEDQIRRFLAANPGFSLIPVAGLWREILGTPCPVETPWLRLTPARHGTDGFFAAVLERRAT